MNKSIFKNKDNMMEKEPWKDTPWI